jgi:hypothetical protein
MAFNVNKFISNFDKHGGYAKSSKFEVRIALPPAITGLGTTEELALQCEAAELPGYAVNTSESKIYGAPTYVAATPSFSEIQMTFICSGDFWEKKLFDSWIDYIIPKKSYLVQYKSNYQTDIKIFQYSEGASLDQSVSRQKTTLGDAVVDALGESARYKTDSIISRKFGNGLKGDLLKGLAGKGLDALFGEQTPFSITDLDGTKIYGVQLLNAFPTTVNPLQLSWASDEIHRLQVGFRFDKWLNVNDLNSDKMETYTITGDNWFQRAINKEVNRKGNDLLKRLFS